MFPLILIGLFVGGAAYAATRPSRPSGFDPFASMPPPAPPPPPPPTPTLPMTPPPSTPAPSAPPATPSTPTTSTTYAPATSSGLKDFDPKGLLNDSRVHPKVREMAAKTAATLQAQGFRPLLAEAYRTIADQRKAFERGASQVTFGWHNTGLAIDIVHYNKAGTGPSWLGDDKALAARFWPAVGKAGLDAGFTEWGGNWTGFVDRPHLQYSPSKITLATAKSRFESGGIPAVWQSAVA